MLLTKLRHWSAYESDGLEMRSNEGQGTDFYFSLGSLSSVKDIRHNFEFMFSLGLFSSVNNMVGDLIAN